MSLRHARPCIAALRAVLAAIAAVVLGAYAVCGQDAPAQAPAAAQEPASAAALTTSTGDLTYANYKAVASEIDKNGVRVARVTRRAELPGGPWAAGAAGDYIIENDQICAIVRGENRAGDPTAGPGTGCIVDLALKEQMWDLLGGIGQLARIDREQTATVLYDKIELRDAETAKGFPSIVATGHLSGVPNVEVATRIGLMAHLSYLIVESHFINTGKGKLEIEILDQVSWGALPPFVGGFGYPSYAKSYLDLKTHWICGVLDDLGIGIVREGEQPLDVARTQYNSSLLFYGGVETEPQTAAVTRRQVLVTRGDMAPFSEYAMRSKKFPFGYLQGTVTQQSDGKPIAGATVEIAQFNPFRAWNASPLPYLTTVTDADGKYRVALPEGGYTATCITPGRPSCPTASTEQKIRADLVLTCDIKQTDRQTLRVEVVDADTSAPLPAKLRLIPPDDGTRAQAFSLGAPWQAQGGRLTYYLKPGVNEVPIAEGTFRCLFSRGIEYDTVEQEVTVEWGKKNEPLRAALHRLPLTKGMVSVDLGLTTDASLGIGRVSAEDLVLAAAGEGIEWIVSGDEGKVTNLAAAIKTAGLQKWLRASAGVRLAYRQQKLFGDFYVFPVPATTKPETLAGLAKANTTPADFFKAVRKAFPDAIVTVSRPAYANVSYLLYNGMKPDTGMMPDGPDYSPDFDAIEVFCDREPRTGQVGRSILNTFLFKDRYRIPLAVSRTATLYYDEPGYPRTYLVAVDDNAANLQDKDLVSALRDGRYFITNGPIVEQTINGKWPVTQMAVPGGKFEHPLRILGAPWVKLRDVGYSYLARMSLPRFILAPDRTEREGQPANVLFPFDDESDQPPTRNLAGKDAFVNVEVLGSAIPVVSPDTASPIDAFAYTPPVLLDAQGDGKYRFVPE